MKDEGLLWKRSGSLYGSFAIGTGSEVSCNEDLEGLLKEGSGKGYLSP
jgi:hypothetical protein